MKRLIASLVVDQNGAWTTRNYNRAIYLGEPSNIVRILNEMEADELSVTWLGSGEKHRFDQLSLISAQASMPLTYSGEVNSVKIAQQISRMGFEKIAITSAYFASPDLMIDLTKSLGRSSIALKIPIIRNGDQHLVWDWKSREPLGVNLSDFLVNLQTNFVGELILSSVNQNGSLAGPDWSLVELCKGQTEILLGYEGGVSSEEEILELWAKGVDGVYVTSHLATYGRFHAPLTFYPKFADWRFSK